MNPEQLYGPPPTVSSPAHTHRATIDCPIKSLSALLWIHRVPADRVVPADRPRARATHLITSLPLHSDPPTSGSTRPLFRGRAFKATADPISRALLSPPPSSPSRPILVGPFPVRARCMPPHLRRSFHPKCPLVLRQF